MHYNKQSTTIDEQVNRLEDRGMLWKNHDLVRRWLNTVGYYRLSAYWLPMEEPPTDGRVRSKKFKAGSKFEDVVKIYVFDRKLRLLVMEALERIEIAVRSRWTNRLALEGGAHAHLSLQLYEKPKEHFAHVEALYESYKKSSEEFIRHYRRKYKTPDLPPLWACTELMTMGELSRWIEATQDTGLKKKLAQDLGLPSANTLSGTLHALSFVRNLCAHHHRLWNRRLVKRIPLIREFESDLIIEPQKGKTKKGNAPDNRLYNIFVILIKMLAHQSPDTTFPNRLRKLIDELNDKETKSMGFPVDWKSRPIWQSEN